METGNIIMKKKGLLVLLSIFVLMFILNSFTPLLSDDYFIAFVWPEGMRINGPLPEATQRVSSFTDFFESVRLYYFTWGGRIPGQSLMTFFVWQGKGLFNILNAFVFVILVAEIYWLSHEGKVNLAFDPSYVFWIFFALWAFNVSFYGTSLWLSGSCEYMWMLVILLAFLIPYVRNYYDRDYLKEDSWGISIGMFCLGMIAGDSRETVVCWIILILSYWLFRSFKKDNVQRWKFSGLFGLCVGYSVLIFAPGNISRLQMQQNTDSFIIANELLRAKSVELVIILLFHFIIWYFIVSFVFKYKRNKEKFIHKDTTLYLNIARLLVLTACGSAIMMFFISSSGLRPSFLNLVCLIIASALLFRLQEVNGVYVINDCGKQFLQFVGCAYLIVTVFFTVWGNYINYNHLQSILISVKEAGKQSSKVVLEVSPSPTSQNSIWLFGSGFHLVPLPVHDDENHEINKTFSHYYGIKGIKIRR